MSRDKEIFAKLADLPPLPKGYVRLVHRCIDKSTFGPNKTESIQKNGLVFNRHVTDIAPSERGGSYSQPSYMVSVFTEKQFWDHLREDKFGCYDDARYADTQIVFDVPLTEFAFLESFGSKTHGKIDSKYIVGVIPNINATNQNLKLSQCYIDKARHISTRKKDYDPPRPNNLKQMIQKYYQESGSKLSKTDFLRIIAQETIKELKNLQSDLEYNSITPKKPQKTLSEYLQHHHRKYHY